METTVLTTTATRNVPPDHIILWGPPDSWVEFGEQRIPVHGVIYRAFPQVRRWLEGYRFPPVKGEDGMFTFKPKLEDGPYASVEAFCHLYNHLMAGLVQEDHKQCACKELCDKSKTVDIVLGAYWMARYYEHSSLRKHLEKMLFEHPSFCFSIQQVCDVYAYFRGQDDRRMAARTMVCYWRLPDADEAYQKKHAGKDPLPTKNTSDFGTAYYLAGLEPWLLNGKLNVHVLEKIGMRCSLHAENEYRSMNAWYRGPAEHERHALLVPQGETKRFHFLLQYHVDIEKELKRASKKETADGSLTSSSFFGTINIVVRLRAENPGFWKLRAPVIFRMYFLE